MEGIVEEGAARVEFEVEPPVFDFWQRILDYLKANPLECCLTFKNLRIDQRGEKISGQIEFSEQAENLELVLQRMKANGEAWSLISVLKLSSQIVSYCIQMEALIQDFKISLKHIFLTEDKRVKLCLFTAAESSCAEVLREITSVGFNPEDAESGAELVAKFGVVPMPDLCEWLKRKHYIAAQAIVENLNSALVGKWNAEAVEPLLRDAMCYSLKSEYAFLKKCEFCDKSLVGDSDTKKYCSQHFACKQCYEEKNAPRCPKCPRLRLVVKKSVPVKESPVETKVSYEEWSDRRQFTCLECSQSTSVEDDAQLQYFLFVCRDHGFCNPTCKESFQQKYIPANISLYSICPKCIKFEQAMISQRPAELEKYLDLIQEAKATVMQGNRRPEEYRAMLDYSVEIHTFIQENLEDARDWPFSLSYASLSSSSFAFALRCLECNTNVFVHKRSRAEMTLWVNRPFLLRCELRVHAVCSDSCYAGLVNTPTCPRCPNSLLFHSLATSRSDEHIPTLEALRRTPCVACLHRNDNINTFPLQSCAHEMCKDCIAQCFDDSHDEYLICKICESLSEKQELFRRVLG